ncbi:hypothetical protein RSAG8_06917, partial [Rhizoctonia solani AG-8 WAC10335]
MMTEMASPTSGPGTLRSQNMVDAHALFQGRGAQSALAPTDLASQHPGGPHTRIDTPLQHVGQHATAHLGPHNLPYPGPPMQRWQNPVGYPPRTLPHPSSPNSGTPAQTPLRPSALSSPLNVNAPVFVPRSLNAPTIVPGSLRRKVPIRISTPNGAAVTFERVPPSPRVKGPIPPKRRSLPVKIETERQKKERLAGELKEKKNAAKEKERERIEKERNAKEEAEST